MPDATTNLLPCPFCGSLDVGYSAQGGHDFVVCNNCGAEGPFSCKTGIAAWNQRTIPWQPIETAPKDGTLVLTISESGYLEEVISDNYKLCNFSFLQYNRTIDTWVDRLGSSGYFPTHWQPLPSPPITPNPNA